MESASAASVQSPTLRRLRTAARLLGTLTGLLLGETAGGAEGFRLRCTVFMIFSGIATTVFFGAMMWLSGEHLQSFNLLSTALLYAGCAAFLRRTRRVDWTLNGIAAVSWICIVGQMCQQGGADAPTSWWLITLPYLVATVGMQRTAIAWLAISALTVLAFQWMEQLGIAFPQRFGAMPLLFAFSAQVGLFAQLVFFALIISAARVESQDRADAAYRQALAASAAKSRFLATMSHEIRTPLNGVIGAADLLDKTEVSEEQRALIETLRYSGTHLKSLIDDILDFSRIEAGKLELEEADFDLAHAIGHTVDALALIARHKGLVCTCRVAPEVPARVRGDAARLRQILSNLVGNAIKFTPAGRVEIDVGCGKGAPPGRSRLVVRVRDTGIGIAADKLPKLFQAFTQADDSTTRLFGGSGLGLAISQELARRMDGEITVESVEGRGTCFTARLDFGTAQMPAPPPTAPAAAPALSEGLRVLLVEDNPVNLALGTAMLERLGCVVETAENGAEGLAHWRERPPDLVLLDCHMPVMDGLSAAREIRRAEARGQRTPIVALTASAFAEDRAACLAAGMDDFLSKPYTFVQLRDVVARHACAVVDAR
ncbi:MAG TPA: ATP-binding protein [Gammaproteobacteria bacterium]|nr:ATP-binding protein [Gammaproteobacteria bacterium]